MAEQKFLGQEGTDVLVEKVKKNAEDILTKQPKLPIATIVPGSGEDTLVLAPGIFLITGYKFDTEGFTPTQMIRDANADGCLFLWGFVDETLSLIVPIINTKPYTELGQVRHGSLYTYLSLETIVEILNNPPETIQLQTADVPVSTNNVRWSNGKLQYYDNNWKDIPMNSTASIEEITAQEVSDKFNA